MSSKPNAASRQGQCQRDDQGRRTVRNRGSADEGGESRLLLSPSACRTRWRPGRRGRPSAGSRRNSSRPMPNSLSDRSASATGRAASSAAARQHLQRAGIGVEADDVAVADPARSAPPSTRFRRHMDRRRHLAGGAGHAPVGHQRHALAAILQDAEHGGQLVQFRHAVGLRPLEADDGDEVAGRASPALKASFSPCWLSNTIAGASMTWRSGLTAEVLMTAWPRLPASTFRPPVGWNALSIRRQHLLVAALQRRGFAHHACRRRRASLRPHRAAGLRPRRCCTSSCSRPSSSSSRIRKPMPPAAWKWFTSASPFG